MKRDKNNRKERPNPSRDTSGTGEVVIFRDIAVEIARLNGIGEEDMNKIIAALAESLRSQLTKYGEADFLGTGKLVVSESPDVDYDFIPYPEETKNMKRRITLQKMFGDKERNLG